MISPQKSVEESAQQSSSLEGSPRCPAQGINGLPPHTSLAVRTAGPQLQRQRVKARRNSVPAPAATASGATLARRALLREAHGLSGLPLGQEAGLRALVHHRKHLAAEVGELLVELLDRGAAQEDTARGPDKVRDDALRSVAEGHVVAVRGFDGGCELIVKVGIAEVLMGGLIVGVGVVMATNGSGVAVDDSRALDVLGGGHEKGAQAVPEEAGAVVDHAVDQEVLAENDSVDALGDGQAILVLKV